MSKLTEQLRDVGVHNAHDFYGHGKPFVLWMPSPSARSPILSRAMVCRKGFKTDPKAHWSDNGNKTFTAFGHGSGADGRKGAMAEAMEWASQRYGIKEWKRDPFGSYGDAEFVTNRIAELKAKAKTLATTQEGGE